MVVVSRNDKETEALFQIHAKAVKKWFNPTLLGYTLFYKKVWDGYVFVRNNPANNHSFFYKKKKEKFVPRKLKDEKDLVIASRVPYLEHLWIIDGD